MKLYYAPGTCALACWISLEWANAIYTVENVKPQSKKYKEINPLGMVPALDLGWERPMTQANAILQHIAEVYPEKKLGGINEEKKMFEFNETMSFLTGDFHPAFWPYFMPFRYTDSNKDSHINEVREASYVRINQVMSHLDELIGSSNHVYQNKRTILDAYAFVMVSWSIKVPKTWKKYKNLSRFMQSMLKDESVQKVLSKSKE